MKILCEVVATDLIPAIRAIMAKELIEKYNLPQVVVSKKLGITEAAVSQYKKGIRGLKIRKFLTNKKIFFEIKKLTKKIANENYDAEKIHLLICKLSDKLLKEKVFDEEILPGPCFVVRI
ncbi:MAG: hypothetical protein QW156_03430 [Candidatus Aenigmatarchaeota archaeon]